MSDAPSDTKNDLLDSLLGDFLDESDQLLSQLNANLLQLDEWVQTLDEGHCQQCDESLMNEMFRAAHSLKGLSAMLGLTDINQLTHKIENVFDAARHSQLWITRDVTELMFMGFDQLTAMVGLLKEPGGEPVDCDAVLAAIQRILQTAGAEKKQTTQADAERALGAATPAATSPLPSVVAGADAAPLANPLEGIRDETDISDNYLAMFVDEADATLDNLTSGLLAMDGDACGEVKGLLADAHKIKGSAASVGLNRAAKLAHLMEDLFEKVVAAGGALTAQSTEVLLKCTDGMRQHVSDLRNGQRASDHFEGLARDILRALQTLHSPTDAARPSSPHTERAGQGVTSTVAGTTFLGEVTFQPNLPTAGLKAQLLHEKLAKLGHVSDCQPPLEQLDTIDQLDSFRFHLTTDQSAETVAGQLRVGGVLHVSVTPMAGESVGPAPIQPAKTESLAPAASPKPPAVKNEPPQPPPETGPRAASTGPRPAETVRVDTDRLDQLMDLAGQLVINKAQFAQIGTRLKTVADCSQAARALDKLSDELDKLGSGGTVRVDGQHLEAELEAVRAQSRRLRSDLEPIRREVQTLSRARDSVRALFEAIHQLDRVSDAVQKGVMDIRMVPVGPLFARFQRVVRDISRANGKQIRLVISGEKTELDKRMIDELGDPLVHLVRNSADHGIETPDARRAAGKDPQGTVTLDAFHRGNSIVIQVRDDGKGLDADRILRKAIDKGLVSEADAQRMTAAQIYQLIWKPGLSTAEKVTDVSGRGMGMDIVKTKLEELSGTVEIASERGKGTTITIKLPLTLAILPSLMVDIAGDVFAMPMEAVTEIVSVDRDLVRSVQGQPMAMVRGRVVSLVRLRDLLTFHDDGTAHAEQPSEITMVVVNDGGQEIGLAVHRVIGEEDVVIKSIAENYQNVLGIAGASILGDGRVALILDVPALIATIARRAAPATC